MLVTLLVSKRIGQSKEVAWRNIESMLLTLLVSNASAVLGPIPLLKAEAASKAQLRVEGLPQVDHESICRELMAKVCQKTALQLKEGGESRLGGGEWRIEYRSDGSFAQQIMIQLPSEDALKNLVAGIHGSGVKVGGRNLAVAVVHNNIATSCAGVLASNLVDDGRGPCL